jgi:hypothetical protein
MAAALTAVLSVGLFTETASAARYPHGYRYYGRAPYYSYRAYPYYRPYVPRYYGRPYYYPYYRPYPYYGAPYPYYGRGFGFHFGW